ncbi:hypothetical protein [Bacillus weihaiensis]|uniref:Uncharacterized protein n=1 Tax=Bacillus weihaiensis TaxID=1547283 RepID=A0A1L3MVT0_9BACI|nr:hypothetical protein [Bacillus weihaiensis]APH06443.1 hypothetical protein A9C19_17845 [Bacillus weihaiensis]
MSTLFTSFSPQAAKASTSNNFQVSNPDIKHVTEKVYLKFTDDGKTLKASKSEVEKIKQKVKESYKQHENDSIYNTKKIDPATLKSNQKEKTNSIEPLATEVSYAEVTNDYSIQQYE